MHAVLHRYRDVAGGPTRLRGEVQPKAGGQDDDDHAGKLMYYPINELVTQSSEMSDIAGVTSSTTRAPYAVS